MFMKYLKYSVVFHKLNNKDSFSEYDYILFEKKLFLLFMMRK